MTLDADHPGPFDAPSAVAERRSALFRETPAELLKRWALGSAWALKPQRIGGLPSLWGFLAADLFDRSKKLPDPVSANAAGICGITHDLSVPTLVKAYRESLFPFAHLGPSKWFSPAERCVLFFDEIHIAKRLRPHFRKQRYRVTFDTEPEAVMKACAGRREGKWHVTWITPRMMHAYAAMFDAGRMHSFEVWNQAGTLVGGGYGVTVGSVFFTESQFAHEPNTSKLGFTLLNWHLQRWGFTLNDNKWPTPTTLHMGFRNIPRAEFLEHTRAPDPAVSRRRWQPEADLAVVADWRPEGAKETGSPGLVPAASQKPAIKKSAPPSSPMETSAGYSRNRRDLETVADLKPVV
jgi:leucyl/phenylalanyl-tRNA--protein transferase